MAAADRPAAQQFDRRGRHRPGRPQDRLRRHRQSLRWLQRHSQSHRPLQVRRRRHHLGPHGWRPARFRLRRPRNQPHRLPRPQRLVRGLRYRAVLLQGRRRQLRRESSELRRRTGRPRRLHLRAHRRYQRHHPTAGHRRRRPRRGRDRRSPPRATVFRPETASTSAALCRRASPTEAGSSIASTTIPSACAAPSAPEPGPPPVSSWAPHTRER